MFVCYRGWWVQVKEKRVDQGWSENYYLLVFILGENQGHLGHLQKLQQEGLQRIGALQLLLLLPPLLSFLLLDTLLTFRQAI